MTVADTPDPAMLRRVRERLSRQGPQVAAPEITAALRRSRAGPQSAADVLHAGTVLDAHLRGLGPLQPLAADPRVSDILVNGPREVWVDRGSGLRRCPIDLGDETAVRALAVRLAAVSGRRLDEATPFADARLPGGVRLHAVLPPVAVAGTVISLRVPSRRITGLDDLIALGAVPVGWCDVLTALVRARVGFIISGATGTGKTTVLSALLAEAAADDRLVIVEDTAELQPAVPHRISIQARHPNSEGAGAVTLSDLVRLALRMRPDRIVVGECRGAEVTDLLAALNTGHSGCGTVHANSAADVPSRLEALGLLAGVPRAALQRQLASGLRAVVHLERDDGGQRRMGVIGIVEDDGVVVRVSDALRNDDGGRTSTGPGWPALARLIGRTVGPPS